ncbi:hypothetical protein K2X14_00280 [Acetobacter sp. TBRC 12305]|uniref:Uncharacterized protein n=1 Tax=Acetobacter garciniae TaxID=2817435 RepID=A0A939KQG1_9PROT|nr:hypothetical protein [Acetobacter garciniae]MBO1323591.1 hypothetical protein [Acetobacter garciniae]MBX0343280.1 hypothetical protein [Acetobacter garciniae]
MSTQKRERSRLAVLLPEPVVTSGKNAPEGIVSDGIIDWDFVLHMWVQPMSSDTGRVYAPCVVFLDDTWVMIGPVGTLDAARQLCYRWSALHDRAVRDQTRSPVPLPIAHEGSVVDIMPAELPGTLPGDPWVFNETERRFRLDLIKLGVDLANSAGGWSLDARIAQIDASLREVSGTFRSSGVVQPHLARAYLAKAREAAVFWATELQAVDDAEVETPEDMARSFVDDIRKGGITFADAYEHLTQHFTYLYGDILNTDGSVFAGRQAYARRAIEAGHARLLYFFSQVAEL